MKKSKKILTTLLVGAVALTAVAGLTACGGNNDGGSAVTAEEWATAFENTIKAENYTVVSNIDMSMVTKATVEGQQMTSNVTLSGKNTYYFDLAGKKSYEDGKLTEKMTGEGLPEEMLGEKTTETKTYSKIDGTTLWACEYDSVNDEWDAVGQPFESENAAKEYFAHTELSASLSAKQYYAAIPAEGEAKALSELYSAFTYADGKYTATLYVQVEGNTYTEGKVTITIKDGYVTLLQAESSGETTQMGATITSTSKTAYAISNIGSTQVTEPEKALAAIDAAKAAPVA